MDLRVRIKVRSPSGACTFAKVLLVASLACEWAPIRIRVRLRVRLRVRVRACEWSGSLWVLGVRSSVRVRVRVATQG